MRSTASKCCFLIWLISYVHGEVSLAAREGQLSAWRSCRSLSTHWARLCSPASAKRRTMARKAAIGEPGPSHLRTKLTPRVYSSASEGAKCDKSRRSGSSVIQIAQHCSSVRSCGFIVCGCAFVVPTDLLRDFSDSPVTSMSPEEENDLCQRSLGDNATCLDHGAAAKSIVRIRMHPDKILFVRLTN